MLRKEKHKIFYSLKQVKLICWLQCRLIYIWVFDNLEHWGIIDRGRRFWTSSQSFLEDYQHLNLSRTQRTCVGKNFLAGTAQCDIWWWWWFHDISLSLSCLLCGKKQGWRGGERRYVFLSCDVQAYSITAEQLFVVSELARIIFHQLTLCHYASKCNINNLVYL